MNGGNIIKTKIQKWGDSYGIIIPSNMLKSLDIKTNDIVELVQEKDRIIISKPKKRNLSLEERFQMFNNLPDNEKGNVESYDWGEDLGKENFVK